jgi:H+/Cl- antiporter ClcA
MMEDFTMKVKKRQGTSGGLFQKNNLRMKLVIEGIGVGLIAGLLVVFYRFLLERTGDVITNLFKFSLSRPLLFPVWIGALILIGYAVGIFVKHEPMISGSGIPQVEGVLLGKLDMTWWKVIVGKLFGGVLCIGAGMSMGREGPSVQLGAAIGQGFSKIFKRIKIEEKYLITCGASAGLAAAFNAPIAGVMFALEEVHKNFSPLVLLSALSAALTADFVSSGFFGLKPIFEFDNLAVLPLHDYFYILLLGIILGVMGVVFSKTLFKAQNLYAGQRLLPKKFWIIVPLLISVILRFVLPDVLGGGNDLIVSLVDSNFPLAFLLILLLGKFLFTMVSYGSGAPGGIFLPLLTVGALIGNAYGLVLVHLFHYSNIYIADFIILAMAGYFTAIVKAPITGTILITEMTGSFNHLLSIAIVSITAYMVADLLGSKPIYESLLERILHKQSDDAVIGNENNISILEYAVCMGSMLDGKQVEEIHWPSHCSLVAIKRGEREIIPTGNLVINPGDYLIVLTNEHKVAKINDCIIKMAESKESFA